jgi:hypothetical protein
MKEEFVNAFVLGIIISNNAKIQKMETRHFQLSLFDINRQTDSIIASVLNLGLRKNRRCNDLCNVFYVQD